MDEAAFRQHIGEYITAQTARLARLRAEREEVARAMEAIERDALVMLPVARLVGVDEEALAWIDGLEAPHRRRAESARRGWERRRAAEKAEGEA